MTFKATSGTIATAQPSTLYEAAADLLRANINAGKLGPGVVLQESALSERFSMSRATVKRALALLAGEKLIGKFAGRGYLVSGGAPLRLDLRKIDLDTGAIGGRLDQPNWQRIQDEVEAELSRCLIFGHYRVVEALVAEEFDVSRTVVRDVLSRLQERGLVQKSANSRWVVEPLTAQRIKDKFELRMILEIAALRSARFDTDGLSELAQDIRVLGDDGHLNADEWFDFNDRFFRLAILSTPNKDLANYISANRSAVEASHRVLFSLGLPSDRQSLYEYCMVIDLLQTGTASAAADMLATHLRNGLNRTIAQLKILSVIDPPNDLAPYLVPA